MLDSRAVVGLVERTLLLALGAVIMYPKGATTEAFRESAVLWWVLLDDILVGFREKNSPEGCRGSGSPKASMPANSATMDALRVSKMLWWVLLRVL